MREYFWELIVGVVVAVGAFALSATVLKGTGAELPVFGLGTFIAGKVMPQTRVRARKPVQS